MGKPPVKATKKLAEAAAIGKARGELKASRLVSFNEKIQAKLFEMIDKIDPLELAAIVTLTYIYKTTIHASEEILTEIKKVTDLPFQVGEMIGFSLVTKLLDSLGIKTGEKPIIEPNKPFDIPEVLEWVIAFTGAYLTVKNADLIKNGIVQYAKGVIGKV